MEPKHKNLSMGTINKKHILLPIIVLTVFLLAANDTYCQTTLKGFISTVREKGESIKVSFSTPVNFYYSLTGDKVRAYTSEDILIGDKYIPKGSSFEGIITKIKRPERFGRDGFFEIDFNEIVTPENLKIPIYASVSTETKKKTEKIAGALIYDSSLITLGTFHGALASIQYGGIPLAITSHGISVLAGAALGVGSGIIGSINRKGNIPTLETFFPIELTLKNNFYILGELPEPSRGQDFQGFRFLPALKKDEINIFINSVKKESSKLYGNYIVLNFNLKNNSTKKFSLQDLVVISEKHNMPIHPDIFLSGLEALKMIDPLEEANSTLAFFVTDHKDNYFLAVIDPLDRKEIVRIPLSQK